MKYMSSGLWEMLHHNQQELTLPRVKTYAQMLLKGTRYMHAHYIMHRVSSGAGDEVHVLRALGDASSQPAGADAAQSEDLRADAVEGHAVYARTLYHAQGK
ncbi:hypothetical protein O0L34_g879 [Tuta absoluta]|nr:hypothetical protein O0L34_g879 [Tuta absoluta]